MSDRGSPLTFVAILVLVAAIALIGLAIWSGYIH
jgi:hypothetical protein